MMEKRSIQGSETTEVAITAFIILCLAIGTVALFGDQIQQVFEGDRSPIIVSANMGNSSAGGGTGNTARTDFNNNLVSSDFISKTSSDLSIGSEVGLETTGTAGGDSSIGGTYVIEDASALNDGDPNTTGNALLDAALAAKKAAMDLLAQSKSAGSLAEALSKQADNLQNKALAEQSVLSALENSVAELAEEVMNVGNHLNILTFLKATSEGIAESLVAALDFTNGINNSIITMTNDNLMSGNDLLALNQQQIDAHNEYMSLKSEYEAGQTTCTDPDTGESYACNTSSVSTEDINSALAQANQLLSQVQGRASALNTTINDLEPLTESLEDAAEDAKKSAKELTSEAKNLIKEAFYDKHLFDDCHTIEQIMNRAIVAITWWHKPVKNMKAVYEAIDLLKEAGNAYEESKKLHARAKKNRENIDQLDETLTKLEQSAASLTLTAKQVDTTDIVQTKDAQLAILTQSDPAISQMTSGLSTLQSSTLQANDQLLVQKALVDELITQSITTSAMAQEAIEDSTSLENAAQSALDEAQQAIGAIVSTP
jgi:uncharacterized coiled-coil DUF342 family protein